jgi:hypothetical protein
MIFRALLVLLIFSPASAFAWGRDGHEIVAAIAQSMLTPKASTQADALLAAAGGESFVTASDWADRIRGQHRETARWHFVDIEVGAGPYDPVRDCKRGACVVEKITEFTGRLADTRFDPETRGEALKWVIHLVGDIHQPLHTGDRHDRGGNAQHVVLHGRDLNLHEIWDTDLLESMMAKQHAVAYAAALARSITPAERAAWSKGAPADWANEAHAIAERVAYGLLAPGAMATITVEYEHAADAAIELQLKRAGVRLAWILNAELK